MLRGKLSGVAVVVAACASMVTVLPAAASAEPVEVAVTCSGSGCDDKDPEATGCASGAVTAAAVTSSKGRIELRYSSTCGTKWVRIPSYAGGSTRPDGKLQIRVWDRPRNVYVNFWASAGTGSHWGNMVYSPGVTRCGWGQVDWNGGATWDAEVKASTC
ncbi:DUF2690 domain-containing protein [Lentzea sp. NPDC004789]